MVIFLSLQGCKLKLWLHGDHERGSQMWHDPEMLGHVTLGLGTALGYCGPVSTCLLHPFSGFALSMLIGKVISHPLGICVPLGTMTSQSKAGYGFRAFQIRPHRSDTSVVFSFAWFYCGIISLSPDLQDHNSFTGLSMTHSYAVSQNYSTVHTQGTWEVW